MAMAVQAGVQDGLRQQGAGLPRFCASSSSALFGVRARQGCAQSRERWQNTALVLRCQATSPVALPQRSAAPAGGGRVSFDAERTTIRLALPSKGRMAEDTLSLLKECQLSVRKLNPRQYIADIPELDNVEVWFQRASDVVRKLRSGDVDLGIVGYDMVREFGEDDEDLVIIHEALGFGHCHLGIGIPTYGIFEGVSSLEELAAMPQWTAERPLRIVTGYTYLGNRFVEENGLKHVQLLTADGALEAAPAMGTADGILDLISSGTTLRENNLKEIAGGQVCSSEGVFVASRRSLLKRKGVLEAAREMLERLEAHLKARNQFAVTANMRGNSIEEVAGMILLNTDFPGLQGPTVAPVFTAKAGSVEVEYFAVTIIVQKPKLYRAVEQLRKVGGSGVLITPLIYIFDEEPPRWTQLLKNLDLPS